ncbi:MAG: glycosyltransferase, partial [Acidimicrobiia bacterium]|nr:glycosyltransferase [Acidimicrobiia bacterium]
TAAQRLLAEGYDVDDAVVIPHGTDVVRIAPGGARRAGTADRGPTLLTWGLIGPGKGLEWAIAAVHLLRDRFPGIRYVIAGRTHPKVQDSHGEDYRRSLEEIVERLGLEDAVEFIDDYLPRPALHKLLGSTDAVVLPYDSTEQVVSGVLTEAIAASVPVVATEFPHAVELAEADAVVTAPHQRPDAIAQALTDLFDAPNQMERMRDAQRRLAPDLEWSSVAARYEALVRSVLKRPVALDA